MSRDQERALRLLAQFAPEEVLARARSLALQMEQDERVRAYLARRAVPIVVAAVAAMAVAGALAYALIVWAQPAAAWRWPVLLAAGLLWLAVSLGLMFAVLSAMQRAALKEADSPPDRPA